MREPPTSDTSKPETKLKPWDELSAIEKREAIAARISGWTRCEGCSFGWWDNTESRDPLGHNHHDSAETLPYWPTNDGLAFTEVWPKIMEVDPDYVIGTRGNMRNEGHKIWNPYRCQEWPDFDGKTWADAICKAAYKLLPVPTK